MVVGVFGALPFVCAADYVLTFSQFSRSMGEKWAKHDVLGGKPVLEWTGHEADSIEISIRLDSSLGVPPSAGVLLLRTMMESRQAYALVVGASYFGRFVIEGMSEQRKHFTGAGICIVDEISLKLTEVSPGWA